MKSGAERQREYANRHPDREKKRKARLAAAERALRERHRDDYLALVDPDGANGTKKYRLALRELKKRYPDEWRRILNDTPR